ncbi:hypothetical protein [Spiroplasma endosymbiont of Virgichneumon dumeticola]|uniref:hypothetical protein n=1 Tax=Spiroplasma endosymbiont of Virgichneumon dumeticola TaxID=3139323 RepID=UPI0035C8DC5A
MHNNKEMYNDNTNWINNILPLIKPLEIDINFKDYLDPTLLINTFNDLKRYYKSVDIYLSYEYETEEWPVVHYNPITTDEKFIPTNQLSLQFSKEFSILNTYNTNKNLKLFEDYNIQYYQISSRINQYVGVSKIGTLPNDIINLYEISKNTFSSNVSYSYDKNINIISNNSAYLGFCDLSDKEFKWKIQLFPIINQVQGADFQVPSDISTWAEKNRQIINYKLTISKIVFNSR